MSCRGSGDGTHAFLSLSSLSSTSVLTRPLPSPNPSPQIRKGSSAAPLCGAQKMETAYGHVIWGADGPQANQALNQRKTFVSRLFVCVFSGSTKYRRVGSL